MDNEQFYKKQVETAAVLNAPEGFCGTLDVQDCDRNAAEKAVPGRALRDNVSDSLRRARKSARTEGQLCELQFLLDKHPEVARILELLRVTGC
jgi:hypothetical protein